MRCKVERRGELGIRRPVDAEFVAGFPRDDLQRAPCAVATEAELAILPGNDCHLVSRRDLRAREDRCDIDLPKARANPGGYVLRLEDQAVSSARLGIVSSRDVAGGEAALLELNSPSEEISGAELWEGGGVAGPASLVGERQVG
jgi:hypothetical protein